MSLRPGGTLECVCRSCNEHPPPLSLSFSLPVSPAQMKRRTDTSGISTRVVTRGDGTGVLQLFKLGRHLGQCRRNEFNSIARITSVDFSSCQAVKASECEMSEQILASTDFTAQPKLLDYQSCQHWMGNKKPVVHAPVVFYWLRIQGLIPKSALIKTEVTDSLWLVGRESYTDELRLCPE